MDALGINTALNKLCKNLKIFEPTEIQRRTIPLILKKQDVIGISETGSGKTACYCLPTLQRLAEDAYGVFALVLLPTKELALQVFEQFQAFCSPLGFKNEICLIVGGDDWLLQAETLAKRPYVVVATPGRLLQLLDSEDNVRCFNYLSVLVLDEAERLLSGTLRCEVDEIFQALYKAESQILLFTATLTSEIEDYRNLVGKLKCNTETHFEMHCPTVINVNPNDSPLQNLEQYYLFIPSTVKLVYLIHVLQTSFENQPGIIFTKTCLTAQLLTTTLELLDVPVTCLHSLLDHKRRIAHLAKFRSSVSSLLVATDVASRGIDIPKVNFVINYDFPYTFEDYVHRVGRTARVNRKGVSLSLISEHDRQETVHEIENRMNLKLELLDLNEDEVLERITSVTKKSQEARQILRENGFFERVALKKKAKMQRNMKTTKSSGVINHQLIRKIKRDVF